MFAALWRHLPGPRWVKAIEALILFCIVVAVLFEFVFPWVTSNTRILDNVVSN
ncbi:MAG: hypothetical protein PT944_04945 [Actinomycetaceae bacterium]|nr:hypothetical protein [Arcanobacterium sp.]MDD7687246.1 hypothetical protein [Actinomycetaceae bacterium]MDY5273456.1 hypothetical protein [Arcanobacterium sp.]